MARGISARGDVLPQLADGTDPDRLWLDYQAALAEWNKRQNTLLPLLSFKTILSRDPVLQSYTGAEWEDASEYGQPVGARPSAEHVDMGYTFKWRDLAARFTRRFLADATKAQTDAVHNAAMYGDAKQVFLHTMAALFNPGARTNAEGHTVFGLWSGDGMVPPEYDGETFDGNHSHYVTTQNAALTQIAVDALLELPREHGYGTGTLGQLLLLVNRQEGNVIRGFRAGVSGSFDFIPGDGAPARLTNETVVGDTPPAEFGDQPLIGAYGPAWVGENSLIPKGYVLAVASGGANSQYNPVGFREHPTAALRGMRLIEGENSDYPIVNSFYERGFGTGVRHRGAAAVLQVTASTDYTVPAAFAGVR